MKIKYLIDTILSPKIQTLDFVDRYAGIVRTINIAEGNGTETGIVKRYPLACNVTGVDCANVGIYQNLVPDDTKKSVIYWEMVSPMTNGGMTKTRDFYRKKFKGTARLVVWLNLAKLGIDNCTDSILVLPILEKEITTKGKITGGIYDGDLLWIEPLRMVNQDINTIFGKYDYNKLKNYYLYPFDFFAIDVQFTLEQCLSKGGTWPCLLPLDCPNSGPVTCKSLNLDGVNEYIDCTNNAAFNQDFNTAFSVSTWVKFDTISLNMALVSKFNPTPKGWQLRVNNSKIGLFLKHATSAPNQILSNGTTIITTGQWYHLAATYDGSNTLQGMKLYVNGISEVVTGVPNSVTGTFQNTEPLLLGQITNGNLASARMWKTELSAAEILEEYNSGEIKNLPVRANNLILNTNINCATWNGAAFEIPDLTGTTAGYISVNSEEEDLKTDCP